MVNALLALHAQPGSSGSRFCTEVPRPPSKAATTSATTPNRRSRAEHNGRMQTTEYICSKATSTISRQHTSTLRSFTSEVLDATREGFTERSDNERSDNERSECQKNVLSDTSCESSEMHALIESTHHDVSDRHFLFMHFSNRFYARAFSKPFFPCWMDDKKLISSVSIEYSLLYSSVKAV